MRLRAVVLSLLALVLLFAGLAALWVGGSFQFDLQGPSPALGEDQEEWARRLAWWSMLDPAGGPLVGAGLIVGIGAVALVVRGRQVAGTRTVSAPASTSARNPTTSPNSSPSSSNSSARSSRTSNVDAFK